MPENETSISEQRPQPEKSNRNRGALFFAIAMALGLFALIALNMK
jgi:hypothetical protein